MVGKTTVIAAIAATSAVAFPYITALICNLTYGWPQVRHRYRRAFHPKKVFSLNLCVIQKMLTSLRYASLYFKMKSYYKSALSTELIKAIPYGRNGQKLDIYLPKTYGTSGDSKRYPVVIYVYGGAWGSGDRTMYGMLCSAIANKLDCIVCCPNHTTYPKGYIDMMVQDIVDTMKWLYMNVDQQKGDKSNMMLVGHSSGAHICAMTMLELLYDNLAPSSNVNLQPVVTTGFQFSERHFDFLPGEISDSCDRHSSGSSGSFLVVDNGPSSQSENGVQSNGQEPSNGQDSSNAQNIDQSLVSSSFDVLQSQISETALSEGSMLESEIRELTQMSDSGLRYRGSGDETVGGTSASGITDSKGGINESIPQTTQGDHDDDDDDDECSDESIETIKNSNGGDNGGTVEVPPTIDELRKCIKVIVGIAGVYHIGDHFQHESGRGVEDISTMARAMRGSKNFDRFSPTHVLQTLTGPVAVDFPKVVLLHGTDDYVVPLSSTTKFSDELKRHNADVTLRIIPSCDHYEICMDLMQPKNKFHTLVMTIIEEAAKSSFV